MKERKVKKRKIKFKALAVIILLLLLLACGIYTLYEMPARRIDIEGNYYLKDNYIINYLDIADKSVLKMNRHKIKEDLLKIDLISSVKIHKNYFGTIKIIIKEEDILFYNWNTKKIVLANGNTIPYKEEYLGVPVLINFVPDDIYNEFIKKMNLISKDVLELVSEIEYSPSIINDKIIDDKRFLFRMNDGNIVYINTINIEKFNNYLELYEAIANKNTNTKGCLYLDSNSNNNHFNDCTEEPINNGDENTSEN